MVVPTNSGEYPNQIPIWMPDSSHLAVIYARVVGLVRLDRYPPYRSAPVSVDHPEPGYSFPLAMPMSSQDSTGRC